MHSQSIEMHSQSIVRAQRGGTDHHGIPPPGARASFGAEALAAGLLGGGAGEVEVEEDRLAQEGEGGAAGGGGDEEAVADGVIEEAALAGADEVGADDDGGRDGEEEDEGGCGGVSSLEGPGKATDLGRCRLQRRV